MKKRNSVWFMLLPLLSVYGCASNSKATYVENYQKAKPTPMPVWVMDNKISSEKVCGIGVAGRAFYAESEEAKALSMERSIENLAGIFGAKISEAMISEQTSATNSYYGHTWGIQYSQNVEVRDELMLKIADQVDMDFWYDVLGEGPFNQKGFTYARACVDYKKAEPITKISTTKLKGTKSGSSSLNPKKVPDWLNRVGRYGQMLCAVGYDLPHFFSEDALDNVVKDIRSQLNTTVQSFVSSYIEAQVTDNSSVISSIDTAITEAISKGVVVTNFWYDRDGIGTHKTKKSTYGWGCVYPVDLLEKATKTVAKEIPQKSKEIQAVRERAQIAFENLDNEIEKHQNEQK